MQASSLDSVAAGAAQRSSPPSVVGQRRGAARSGARALGLYALLSLIFFGGPVLPLIGSPQSTIIAKDPIDSSLFMWFFAWWPHALLNGINPFVTHAMFVPEGFNLQWTTSMPGPSVLLSPVTLALGSAVTWNVIQLLAPALSAWTAFLLCRYVTARTGPSLVGGYLFGFSPYVLAHLTGGPFLALVPLLPVFVLLVLRRLDASLSRRRFVALMALALIGQFSISTEVLLTAALFGALALVVAYALFAERRRALISVTGETVGAGVVMAVVVSPFLYYFFFGRHYPPIGTFFSASAGSFVQPPYFLELTTRSHLQAGIFQGSGESYLGIPLLVLIGAFAWQRRRSRVAWLAVLCIAIAAVFSLGRVLYTNGRFTSIPLPWQLVEHLPVLRYAIPVRLAVFAILPAALVAALWLADRGGIWRWGLAVLTVASFLPNVGNAAWRTPIRDPAFFSDGAYRRYLKPADHVLTVPTLGPSERWQADTGFRFELAAGYAGAYPASYSRFATWNTLLTGVLTPGYASQLRRFVAAKGVTAIVVAKSAPGPWRTLFGSLGVPPLDIGGVLLYRLTPALRKSIAERKTPGRPDQPVASRAKDASPRRRDLNRSRGRSTRV